MGKKKRAFLHGRNQIKASILVSALALLLLFSTLFLFFLEDYRLKRRFNTLLGNYYIAESIKEWSQTQYLADPSRLYFSFTEGTVQIEEQPKKEIVRYTVKVGKLSYNFDDPLIVEEEIETEIEGEVEDAGETVDPINPETN